MKVVSSKRTPCQNHLTTTEFGDVSRSAAAAAAHIVSSDARLQKAMQGANTMQCLEEILHAHVRRKYYATDRDHLVAKVQRVTHR